MMPATRQPPKDADLVAPGFDRAIRTVLLWGTYDLDKPRTRLLRDGLASIGVEVIEVHKDIWAGHADKSQLSRLRMIGLLLQVLLSYPRLIFRYLRAPDHDLVLVPYMGQFDVLILWPFAWLRRRPVVWDMFLSLYDTVVNDRKLAPARSISGYGLYLLEWLGCRAAASVLWDTSAHANRMSRLFRLKPGKVDAVPVGAEPGAFKRLPARTKTDAPTRLLFYGQISPLHGIDTILAAAVSDRGRRYQWRIIGTGQDQALVDAARNAPDATHISWDAWVPYDRLADEIAQADICLGIFGISEKAASVVPNKVFQALFSGRPVITRASPAMSEAFPDAHAGLQLVPPADPMALLDAVERLEQAGFPRLPPESLDFASPEQIARQFCTRLAPLVKGR